MALVSKMEKSVRPCDKKLLEEKGFKVIQTVSLNSMGKPKKATGNLKELFQKLMFLPKK